MSRPDHRNRRSAAALAYDPTERDGAPHVVAKGYGLVADMIVQRAREAGLYVHEAPEMVSLLMQVDLDARIPPALYQAVAELLAWLHRLESGLDVPPPHDHPHTHTHPADSDVTDVVATEIGNSGPAR